jgi:hypothetical protein
VCLWDAATGKLLCKLLGVGSSSLARTPGGYCRFGPEDPSAPFVLLARRPDRRASALHLPLAGLRDVLDRPDKVEAALAGDLSGDGDLDRDLEAHGWNTGSDWDGDVHILPATSTDTPATDPSVPLPSE